MAIIPETIEILYQCSTSSTSSTASVKKCSAATTPKTLVCVICGNAYHISCAKKIKSLVYIKGYLIKCCRENSFKPKTTEEILINDYKTKLNENNETIKNLKIELQNYKEANEPLDAKLNKIEKKSDESAKTSDKIIGKPMIELIESLKREIFTLQDLVSTKQALCESMSENLKEIKKSNSIQEKLNCNINNGLNEENKSLKQINKVLENNNLLLNEKINNLQINSDKNSSEKFYANAIKANLDTLSTHKIPGIIIEFIENKDKKEIKKLIQDNILTPNQQINIKSFFQLKDGKLIIRNSNDEDTNTITKKIKEIFQDKVKVTKEELLKPRIKIVGFNKNLSIEELNQDIVNQNFKDVQNPEFSIYHKKKIYLVTLGFYMQK